MTSGDVKEDGPLPPTDMLYMTYEGNFWTECESKILNVSKVEGDPKAPPDTFEIVLDQTVMHAQGGGQPTDIGTLVPKDRSGAPAFQVSKVLIDRTTGIARHTGTGSELQVGDTVHVAVDKDRRRILSECHSSGHVVDSALARCGMLLKPSKAYHFLEGPYVEYQGSIPPEEKPKKQS